MKLTDNVGRFVGQVEPRWRQADGPHIGVKYRRSVQLQYGDVVVVVGVVKELVLSYLYHLEVVGAGVIASRQVILS